MSSIVTHAVAGAALAVMAEENPSAATAGTAALCAIFPDLDGIGYLLGIPYGAIFGHRGLLHSLTCAVLVAAVVTLLFYRHKEPLLHFVIFFAATASHGLLDALTDGGLGVAFFSPFDSSRYFFPFRPILVSPIGIRAFFTRYGLAVMRSEVLWVWLPLLAAVAATRLGHLGLRK